MQLDEQHDATYRASTRVNRRDVRVALRRDERDGRQAESGSSGSVTGAYTGRPELRSRPPRSTMKRERDPPVAQQPQHEARFARRTAACACGRIRSPRDSRGRCHARRIPRCRQGTRDSTERTPAPLVDGGGVSMLSGTVAREERRHVIERRGHSARRQRLEDVFGEGLLAGHQLTERRTIGAGLAERVAQSSWRRSAGTRSRRGRSLESGNVTPLYGRPDVVPGKEVRCASDE